MALVETLKEFINLLTTPAVFISLATALFFASLRYKAFWRPKVALGVGVFAAFFVVVSLLDPDFALIVKKPDNVPIVAMLFLVGFFTWLSFHQAHENDARIAAGRPVLEKDDGEDRG